jgi:hypothetical protein
MDQDQLNQHLDEAIDMDTIIQELEEKLTRNLPRDLLEALQF